MKTEPTDLDYDASPLFRPAHGIRMMNPTGAWCRIVGIDGERVIATCEQSGDRVVETEHTMEAIDTNDPATVGCMLAQVEGMRPGLAVTIVDRLVTIPNEPDRRFAVLVSNGYGVQDVFTGPTRGAAIVAAMKTLKRAT